MSTPHSTTNAHIGQEKIINFNSLLSKEINFLYYPNPARGPGDFITKPCQSSLMRIVGMYMGAL